jgi:hypothetical protein
MGFGSSQNQFSTKLILQVRVCRGIVKENTINQNDLHQKEDFCPPEIF